MAWSPVQGTLPIIKLKSDHGLTEGCKDINNNNIFYYYKHYY
jgi:hypothetical protein